jgi:hypothetical protein
VAGAALVVVQVAGKQVASAVVAMPEVMLAVHPDRIASHSNPVAHLLLVPAPFLGLDLDQVALVVAVAVVVVRRFPYLLYKVLSLYYTWRSHVCNNTFQKITRYSLPSRKKPF